MLFTRKNVTGSADYYKRFYSGWWQVKMWYFLH